MAKTNQQKLYNRPLYFHKQQVNLRSACREYPNKSLPANWISVSPLSIPENGAEDVLILYSRKTAMPSKRKQSSDNLGLLSWEEAVENCDEVKFVLSHKNGDRDSCMAIVPNFESHIVFNYMRIPESGPGGKKYALRLVSRGQQLDGNTNNMASPGYEMYTKPFWKALRKYLESLDDVLQRLKPVAESVAKRNDHDGTETVIVMICNFGQSELLLNFVCAARSRGLDTSNILVFATDQKTKEILDRAGLTVYYDETVSCGLPIMHACCFCAKVSFLLRTVLFEKLLGDIPSGAAQQYGDRNFIMVMLAKVKTHYLQWQGYSLSIQNYSNVAALFTSKVYCVQLTLILGYDVLFQDVDIIWYKHPFDYFLAKNSPIYSADIILQDDGSRSKRYAPFSGNSGFYYVRNNKKTQHLFNQLLVSGNEIQRTQSHQQTLTALLAEHASLYALKVKILERDRDDMFPGGYHFHFRGKDNFFYGFFRGEKSPYLFHMSWTLNKDNKLLFLRQLGEWYVQDQCIGRPLSNITAAVGDAGDVVSLCCSANALFSCHYRDKPSAKPCHDSPPIEPGKPSWWK
jgi:hypothetical protein